MNNYGLSLGDSDGDYKFSCVDILERKELDETKVGIPLKYIGDGTVLTIGKVNGHIRLLLESGVGMDGWMLLMDKEGNILYEHQESADEYQDFSPFLLDVSQKILYLENQYHLSN